MDKVLAENRWSVLYITGFALFVTAVLTGSAWLIAPATVFVLIAAVGRPLAEVRWPGGSIRWQNEAIREIWRITNEEVVDAHVREAMEDAQREAMERGEGMGSTTSGQEVFSRAVSPQEFARFAVEDVVRTLDQAEDFARARGLKER